MRLWSLSAVSRLFLSDTLRHNPMQAGAGGLGHKPRHKFFAAFTGFGGSPLRVQNRGWGVQNRSLPREKSGKKILLAQHWA